MRKHDLEIRRRPVKPDAKITHDWRRPAANVAERAIMKLEDQLEYARDELATDLGRTASKLRCSHFVGAAGDPLSALFTTFDSKVEQATRAFRRALGVPVPPLDD